MTSAFTEQLHRLPNLLANHVLISTVAIALATAIALPLGMFTARMKTLRWATLTAASIIQTIPALALLALIFASLVAINHAYLWAMQPADHQAPLRAIGFLPTIIALTLYAILPILRNTVTGIVGVSDDVTEAARGLGLTPRQILWQVQLPLAMPVILAGLRTATVWTVGMATLSTLVGQPSLGNYIFQGLQNRLWSAVLIGCLAAAALAIVLDQLLGIIEIGFSRRSKPAIVTASLAMTLVLIGGLAPLAGNDWFANTRQRVVEIGAKPFNESSILANLIQQRLSPAFNTSLRQNLGSTVAFDALASNDLDCYVDYTGTIWANIMHRKPIHDPAKMRRQMTAWLKSHKHITALGSLGFEDAYALAVRTSFAQKHHLRTISDLAAIANHLSLASDPEFFGRPVWRQLKTAYHLHFASTRPMQSTLMYQALANGEVNVITAYTSDARIDAYHLTILKDDRHVFPPYDAVLLLSPRAAKRKRLIAALKPLIGKINVNLMRKANKHVSIVGHTPAQAAHWLRSQLNLPRVHP